MKGLPFVVIAVTCHLQAYPDVHDVSALPSSVGYSLAHHRSGYKESAAGMPFADLTLEPGTRAFIFQSMGMIRERSSYREGGCAFVRAERRECVCQGDLAAGGPAARAVRDPGAMSPAKGRTIGAESENRRGRSCLTQGTPVRTILWKSAAWPHGSVRRVNFASRGAVPDKARSSRR